MALARLGAHVDKASKVSLSPPLVSRGNVLSCQRWAQDGVTPTYMAAEHGQAGCVAALARCGADVNKASNVSALRACSAVAGGCAHDAAVLGLQRDATPTYIAAQNGHAACIEALVRHGADVNQAKVTVGTACITGGTGGDTGCTAEQNGATPTYTAAQTGAAECIDVLARHGADVDKANAVSVAHMRGLLMRRITKRC